MPNKRHRTKHDTSTHAEKFSTTRFVASTTNFVVCTTKLVVENICWNGPVFSLKKHIISLILNIFELHNPKVWKKGSKSKFLRQSITSVQKAILLKKTHCNTWTKRIEKCYISRKSNKKLPTWNNKTNYDNRIIFSLLPYWLFSLSSLFVPIPVKGQAEKLLKIPIKARRCRRY